MNLETKRLILREWHEKDIPDLIEGLNNLNVSKWLAMVSYPYTLQEAKNWISYCQQEVLKTERNSYEWAIELKSEKKIIGGVTLNKINKLHQTAGGGIWISEKYQGHGYGREAFGERIRFAFEDLNLRRLENGVLEGNPSSLRMQKKFGYQVEGVKRKALLCRADGKIKDETITGLLKEAWIRE